MKPRTTFRQVLPDVPIVRDVPSALTGLEPASTAVLAGAGVSVAPPSMLPTATRFLEALFDTCLPESVDRGVLKPQRAHALAAPYGALRFEAVVDLVQHRFDPSLDIAELFDSAEPNPDHALIAELALRGALVITTNFDVLIETSVSPQLLSFASDHDFRDFGESGSAVTPAVWHLHGAVRDAHQQHDRRDTIVASVRGCWRSRRLFAAGATKREFLQRVLADRDLIVVGYSGSDDFDICPALERIRSDRRVVWIDHAESTDIMDEIDLRTIDTLPDGFQWYRHSGRNVLAAMVERESRDAETVAVLRCASRSALAAVVGKTTVVHPSVRNPTDPTRRFMRDWQVAHMPTEADRRLFGVQLLRAANKHTEARDLLRDVVGSSYSVQPNALRSTMELLSVASFEASELFSTAAISEPSDLGAEVPDTTAVPVLHAVQLLMRARVLERQGRPAEAVPLIEESLRVRREIGLDQDLDAVLHAKARALFIDGYAASSLAAAADAARDALTEAERTNNPEGIALCNLLLARVHERIGDRSGALGDYDAAVAAARASGLESLVAQCCGEQGLFLWIEGDRADHRRAAELLADAFRGHFVDRDFGSLAIVASNLALCLESLGEGPRTVYADCIAYQCFEQLRNRDGAQIAFARIEERAPLEGLPVWRPQERRHDHVNTVIRALRERGVAM